MPRCPNNTGRYPRDLGQPVIVSHKARSRGIRASLPEALRGDSGSSSMAFMQGAQRLPLLVFVAHVVEGIQAPGDFNRPCLDLCDSQRESPARGVN